MDVYFLHIKSNIWIFYSEPRLTSTDILKEKKATNFRSRFLERISVIYSEALIYINTSQKLFWVWIRKILNYLEKFIHPYEFLMKALRTTQKIKIFYPKGVSEKFVIKKWNRLLKQQRRSHGRGIILNLILLPFTALATIIPGPNIFVAWNGLRLYSHSLAKKGIEHALSDKVATTLSINEKLVKQNSPTEVLTLQYINMLSDQLHLTGLKNYLARLNYLPSE